jgi:hypothetical protein
MTALIKVIERSILLHGEGKPLTLGHLCNILKKVEEIENRRAEIKEREHAELMEEISYLGQD